MAETKIIETKVWWRSKNFWAAIITLIIWMLSVAEGFTENRLYTAILALATSVLWLILRGLTDKPISLRDGMVIIQQLDEVSKEWKTICDPAAASTTPWPAPNMDGTPFEEKKENSPGYIEKE